jgi:hypothetical protein
LFAGHIFDMTIATMATKQKNHPLNTTSNWPPNK